MLFTSMVMARTVLAFGLPGEVSLILGLLTGGLAGLRTACW